MDGGDGGGAVCVGWVGCGKSPVVTVHCHALELVGWASGMCGQERSEHRGLYMEMTGGGGGGLDSERGGGSWFRAEGWR
eukprot:360883-Chlamydomonas_euryale.AAC.1